MKRFLGALLAFAVGGACTHDDESRQRTLGPEESKRLAALSAELEKRAEACTATFRAATTPEALGALAITDERCHAPLDAPAVGRSNTKTLDTKYFQVWTVRRTKAGAAVGEPTGCNPWKDALDAARLEPTRGYLGNLESVARAKTIGSFEALVLVSDEKPPVSTGDGTFTPGALRGRAYVYDHGAGRVVCAGDVDTASSTSVPVRFRAQEMNVLDADFQRNLAAPKALERDLEAQLRRAITTQLKRVAVDAR